MQDTRTWTPPAGVLGRILAQTSERVAALRAHAAELNDQVDSTLSPPSFSRAIAGVKTVAVIAEVKRKSPSKGVINPGLDAVQQALAYEQGGATAVSVLTESENFGGSLEDLVQVAQSLRIPALRKDFCIDPLQLLEARASGAAAMLLIARAIPPEKLLELAAFASGIGLETLVEIRSEVELEVALQSATSVIGVNNRNLETLEIAADVSQRLIPLIPPGRLVVFESGVTSRADVERAALTGADAILVGSALSAASAPSEFVHSLTGVPRRNRASRD